MAAEELNEELAKSLQLAKKKPCNFAIVGKGANVLALLVEKKPIKDGALLKTKKEVQGNVVVKGVVRWDAAEFVFQVAEEPGIGEVKLRKFITEETKLTAKARFEVVPNLQEVDDQEDEAVESSGEESSTVTETATTEEKTPAAAQLMAGINKLSDAIKAAIVSHPALKGDITALIASFREHLAKGEDGEARGVLFEVAALLKGLGQRDFDKIHLDWDSRKKQVQDRLATLRKAVLGEADDPVAPTAAGNLELILGRFNEGLGDTLDALQKAADSKSRATLKEKANGIAERYLAFLQTDALVKHVEANPFEIVVGVQDILAPPLNQLKVELQKLV